MKALLRRLRARAMGAATASRRAYWKRSLVRNRRRFLSQTVRFDGTPTMRGLSLLLGFARNHGWRGRLNSSDRRAGVAERYGKSSQAALFRGWTRRLPGYLPANPPGRSSHELRSDGAVVFGRPPGAELPWWMLGLDVSDDGTLVRILHEAGIDIRHPYYVGSEMHHVNVIADPTLALVRLKLI